MPLSDFFFDDLSRDPDLTAARALIAERAKQRTHGYAPVDIRRVFAGPEFTTWPKAFPELAHESALNLADPIDGVQPRKVIRPNAAERDWNSMIEAGNAVWRRIREQIMGAELELWGVRIEGGLQTTAPEKIAADWSHVRLRFWFTQDRVSIGHGGGEVVFCDLRIRRRDDSSGVSPSLSGDASASPTASPAPTRVSKADLMEFLKTRSGGWDQCTGSGDADWEAAKSKFPSVTRDRVRAAREEYGPKGARGRPRKGKAAE